MRDEKNTRQAGDLERYRSTPLRPAVWMTSVLMWATVVALILRVPTWASIFLCTITGVSFLVFLVGYIYLFARDREELRAERYRDLSSIRSSRDESARQQPELEASRQIYLGPDGPELAQSRGDELRVEVGEGGSEPRD